MQHREGKHRRSILQDRRIEQRKFRPFRLIPTRSWDLVHRVDISRVVGTVGIERIEKRSSQKGIR